MSLKAIVLAAKAAHAKGGSTDAQAAIVTLSEDLEAANNGLKYWDGIRKENGELRDQAKSLRARVAELEAAGKWIKCSERLPKFGETVIVFDHENENVYLAMVVKLIDGKPWWVYVLPDGLNYTDLNYVEEWSYLPAAPKGGE